VLTRLAAAARISAPLPQCVTLLPGVSGGFQQSPFSRLTHPRPRTQRRNAEMSSPSTLGRLASKRPGTRPVATCGTSEAKMTSMGRFQGS
jgi:hypothetical protein